RRITQKWGRDEAGVASGVPSGTRRNVFRTFRWGHWFVGIKNGEAVRQGRLHRSRRRDGGCLASREKREAKQADDKVHDQNQNARQIAIITTLPTHLARSRAPASRGSTESRPTNTSSRRFHW